MPGLRLLLIALFVWIVWIFVKGAFRKQLQKKEESIREKDSSSDKIVKCDVCGLHVPQNEALSYDGKFYCSEAHRRQAG